MKRLLLALTMLVSTLSAQEIPDLASGLPGTVGGSAVVYELTAEGIQATLITADTALAAPVNPGPAHLSITWNTKFGEMRVIVPIDQPSTPQTRAAAALELKNLVVAMQAPGGGFEPID